MNNLPLDVLLKDFYLNVSSTRNLEIFLERRKLKIVQLSYYPGTFSIERGDAISNSPLWHVANFPFSCGSFIVRRELYDEDTYPLFKEFCNILLKSYNLVFLERKEKLPQIWREEDFKEKAKVFNDAICGMYGAYHLDFYILPKGTVLDVSNSETDESRENPIEIIPEPETPVRLVQSPKENRERRT